jgi:hypothetical protein
MFKIKGWIRIDGIRINGHVKSLYAWIHKSTFVGYLHDNIQLKIPNFDGSPLIKHQPMWKPTNE